MLFFVALIAKGWFLRAKSFTYSPGTESIPTRFKVAFSRWFYFLLFWIIGLVTVPTGLVGLAFAGWLVWIMLDLRRILGEMDNQVELKSEHQ